MKRATAVAVIAAVSIGAVPPADLPIWQTLNEGDAPSVVASKLSSMEGVKAAKVKGRSGSERVSLSYTMTGLVILGRRFGVIPQFEGGQLAKVGLGTEPACIGGLEERDDKLIEALKLNYPTFLVGPNDKSELLRAQFDATETRPATVATIMTDGKVVAFLTRRFTRKDPPPSIPFGATSSMRAAGRFLWSQYNSVAAECDGTGQFRVQTAVTFMSKPKFDAEVSANQADGASEVRSAAGKL